MAVCWARSSALVIGVVILVLVRKAARFAVYELTNIRVKNLQTPAIIRVDEARGAISVPDINRRMAFTWIKFRSLIKNTDSKGHYLNSKCMYTYISHSNSEQQKLSWYCLWYIIDTLPNILPWKRWHLVSNVQRKLLSVMRFLRYKVVLFWEFRF